MLAPCLVIFFFKNMSFWVSTHQYFGWKGVYYREYGYFIADLDPTGDPAFGLLLLVPPELSIFVKEL